MISHDQSISVELDTNYHPFQEEEEVAKGPPSEPGGSEAPEARGRKRAGKKKSGAQKKREKREREEGSFYVELEISDCWKVGDLW